jgi:hypothetical protein
MNFLEQLVSEWFTLRGYFVRTNLKFGKRRKGGWSGEIDIAAFSPETRELVHVETSMDADRWDERRRRFSKKFAGAGAHLKDVFPFEITAVRRIAIVGFSRTGVGDTLGEGIEVKTLAQFIREVCQELRRRHPLREAIPEVLPILRAMQFAVHWGADEIDGTTSGAVLRGAKR